MHGKFKNLDIFYCIKQVIYSIVVFKCESMLYLQCENEKDFRSWKYILPLQSDHSNNCKLVNKQIFVVTCWEIHVLCHVDNMHRKSIPEDKTTHFFF